MYDNIKIQFDTLKNGLGVATDTVLHVGTVIVGFAVHAGSKNETSINNGVAHFLEHMAFKGTTTRSAKDISDAIEGVGGYMNAYTSKEKTVYYIKVLKEDVGIAVEILHDIMQNSLFDEAELTKERGVILQELAIGLDTPSDVVMDYFAEATYGVDTPLGRSIIGTKETILSMKRDYLKDFMHDHYSAKNIVFGACGNISHEEVLELAQKYFSSFEDRPKSQTPVCKYQGGGIVIKSKEDLEQMQFLLGVRGVSTQNLRELYKVNVVSNILGSGMSSRLFQEVREKRGLAYSVAASCDAQPDDGVFVVYADGKSENLELLLDAVANTVKEAIVNIDESETNRTIKQYIAAILMQQESVEARLMKMLSNYSNYGRYIYPNEIVGYIREVTPKIASETLLKLFSAQDKNETIVAYGDFGNDDHRIDSFDMNKFVP